MEDQENTYMIIPLTRGWSAWVDLEDYSKLVVHQWQVKLNRGNAYAVRSERGKSRRERRQQIWMHRVIMGAFCGGEEVDHLEHRPSGEKVVDNRRRNLRVCSHKENSRNRRKSAACASIFKGVTRTRKWWQARIMVAGKVIELGCFRDEGHAALAYDVSARRLHGEFAHTNFL